MRRETPRSLPGIARADSTTVSPGPAETSRCSPWLIVDSADSGSPWLPETKTSAREAKPSRSDAGSIRVTPGSRSSPSSSAVSALSTIRRPRNATGRPASAASRATRLDARDRGREAGDEHAPARPRQRLLERGHERALARRRAGHFDVRAVGEQGQHSAVAPRRQRLEIRAVGGSGLRVQLEVAAREHDAGRRLDREREAVEHAVRDADRVHAEGADLHGLAGPERPQIRLDPALHEPTPREAEREPAAVDGHRRRLERVGERADVVLVPVREQDAAHPAAALGEVLEVGNDRVDPRHLRGGEEHPRVDQEQMVLPLQDQGVQSELAQAAEWDETNGLLRLSRASLHCLAPRRRRPPTPPKGAPGPQPIGPRRASTPQG